MAVGKKKIKKEKQLEKQETVLSNKLKDLRVTNSVKCKRKVKWTKKKSVDLAIRGHP